MHTHTSVLYIYIYTYTYKTTCLTQAFFNSGEYVGNLW